MSSFCTFFDHGYLPQGLALWTSLHRQDPAVTVWVLVLDAETEATLRALAVPGLKLVVLEELLAADPELAAIQKTRSRQEFIFTLKPCLCRFLLRLNPATSALAYLDADIFFFRDAEAVHRELAQHSILVVPHRYPPWHDDTSRYGRFNAGLLAFRGDEQGMACLDRWRAQCLASCALAADGVVYGDQKYLDEWPERFGEAVCVSRNPGLNLAPWNWAAHRCVMEGEGAQVDGAPLVAFHFAQFRPITSHWFDSGQLEYGIMPLGLRSHLYGKYWAALLAAESEIRRVRPAFIIPRRGWKIALGAWHLAFLRLFWGQFWLKIGPWWFAGRFGLGRFSGRALGIYRRAQRRDA